MSGSWAGHEWMILRRTDSWIHIIDTRIICFRARARTIGKENNAFMIKLWKDFHRLMNGTQWFWKKSEIDTIRANGHAKLTVYEWFMRGSWEVYEWLMSRRRVANAAQPLILDFFESSTRLSYSSGIPNISDSWVTSQNITAGVAYQKKDLWVAAVSCKTFMRGPVFFFSWEAAAPVIWLCIHGVWQYHSSTSKQYSNIKSVLMIKLHSFQDNNMIFSKDRSASRDLSL